MVEVKKHEKTGSGRGDETRKLEKAQAATSTQIQTGGERGIQSTTCQIKKGKKKKQEARKTPPALSGSRGRSKQAELRRIRQEMALSN